MAISTAFHHAYRTPTVNQLQFQPKKRPGHSSSYIRVSPDKLYRIHAVLNGGVPKDDASGSIRPVRRQLPAGFPAERFTAMFPADVRVTFRHRPPPPPPSRRGPAAQETLPQSPPAPRGSGKRRHGSPGRKSRGCPKGCSSTGCPHPGRTGPENRRWGSLPADRLFFRTVKVFKGQLQRQHFVQGFRRRVVVQLNDDLSAIIQ